MRLLRGLLAALFCLAVLAGGSPQAFAGPAALHPVVHAAPSFTPPGMTLIFDEEWNSLSRRGNGPSEEGLATGTGRWQFANIYGRYGCIGHAGQQAEWQVDPTTCNPGGGYPANGELSVSGGLATFTVEKTPSTLSASLPLTYAPFVVTASGTSNVLTVTAVTSGAIQTGAVFTGSGVAANCYVTSKITGTGGTGTYGFSCANFASTAITSTGAWPYVASQITTRQAFKFIPAKPWCMEVRVYQDALQGFWGSAWTLNDQSTPFFNALQAEVDLFEHMQGAGAGWTSNNYHWSVQFTGNTHTTTTLDGLTQDPAIYYGLRVGDGLTGTGIQAGTTISSMTSSSITLSLAATATTTGVTITSAYLSSNSETVQPYSVENGFHTYRACDLGDHLLRITQDGRLISTFKLRAGMSSWFAQKQYILLTPSAGNNATFPGFYLQSTGKFIVDYVRFWMANPVKNVDYFVNETGDGTGKGPELTFPQANGALNVTSGAVGCQDPGFCTNNTSTSSTGSSVDSLPIPMVIASGGATWNRFEHYGTAPVSGVISGHTYTITEKFNYGTGGHYLALGQASTIVVDLTSTGTTVTPVTGTCASAAITTVGSHKELTCQYTATATGGLYWAVGPNSATVGQTVILYSVSARDNVPTT